jgi:hypothetical protein
MSLALGRYLNASQIFRVWPRLAGEGRGSKLGQKGLDPRIHKSPGTPANLGLSYCPTETLTVHKSLISLSTSVNFRWTVPLIA